MDFRARMVMIVPGTLGSMILLTLLLLNITSGLSNPTLAFAAAPEVQVPPQNNGHTEVYPIANSISLPQAQNACKVSSSYPESILQWCDWITHYSEKRSLSPDLIAALIWQESGGNHLAYSKSGAVGLMQVMPSDGIAASFNCINGPCFATRPTTDELQDPEFNIAFGTKYLSQQLERHGNLRSALKAYGPMNVGFYYADKVLAIYENHRAQP
jgi:soluble lytic murein transglycosylase-like protein